jgi:DNA primase
MTNTMTIDGIEMEITNPGRVLWPDVGITKIEYYSRA